MDSDGQAPPTRRRAAASLENRSLVEQPNEHVHADAGEDGDGELQKGDRIGPSAPLRAPGGRSAAESASGVKEMTPANTATAPMAVTSGRCRQTIHPTSARSNGNHTDVAAVPADRQTVQTRDRDR